MRLEKKAHTMRPWLIVLLALALLLSVTGGLAARYMTTAKTKWQMVSAGFHISSELLKENTPTGAAYCNADGNFTIPLHNYEVENVAQISQVDIAYEITVTNGTLVSVKNGDTAVTPSGGRYTLPGDGTNKVTHTITVTPTSGTVPQVTVSAKTPYIKTLSGKFNVSGNMTATYATDAASGVTTVTIHTNQYDDAVTLKWADTLYPNAGVNEKDYGWAVGYDVRTALKSKEDAGKEKTFLFEFNTTAVSSVSVSGGTVTVS